jgi:monoamine oxidase
METVPGGQPRQPAPGPQSSAARRSGVMLAMFAQPEAQPEPPRDAQPPANAQPPADAPPAQPNGTEAPPAENAPGGTPKTESAPAPATQPSTTAGSGEEEAIILHGKVVRGAAADALHKEVDAVLARVIELARGVDPVRPWTSPNAAELDAKSFAAFIDEQKGLSDDARALMLSAAETDNGVVTEHMSLLAYLAMVAGGGFQAYFEDSEIYRLADGNDALATALAQKLGERVRFNSAVDLVRREADAVYVRTRDGGIFRGDAVVVAVPPSVWERIQLLPPLSQALTPQMGENVKLILALREPVWERQGLAPELTSDGLVGMTWASSDPLSRGPVGLTLFSGGTQAGELRRLMPEIRNARALESLSPAFPDLPALLIRSRFVDWPGMPLTRASYSFPAPGQVVAFGPALVDGIRGDGYAPLMFAGEHTSYGFVGYMEGALSSGVRAAHALLNPPATVVIGTAPAETTPAGTQPAETQPTPMEPVAPQTAPTEAAPGPAAPNDAAPAAPDAPPAPDAAPPEPKPAEPAPVEGNKDLVPA